MAVVWSSKYSILPMCCPIKPQRFSSLLLDGPKFVCYRRNVTFVIISLARGQLHHAPHWKAELRRRFTFTSRVQCNSAASFAQSTLNRRRSNTIYNKSFLLSPTAADAVAAQGQARNYSHFREQPNNHYLSDLISPAKNMAEAQRKGFREKHKKRHRASTIPLDSGSHMMKLDTNGKCSVQVIGSGTKDCPPSLLVITGNIRFLFNCGEGTQRLICENRVKNISRLEHIFFTRMTWENIGGAVGMMITLKNVGLPKLSLYGPPQLADFSNALQIYAKHEAIHLEVNSYVQSPFFSKAMNVIAVPLFGDNCNHGNSSRSSPASTDHPSPSESLSREGDEEDVTDRVKDDRELDGKRKAKDPFDVISEMAVKHRNQDRGAKRRKLDDSQDVTVAYICKLHDTPGRLHVQKAIDLGLKPSPEYSKLKAGHSVTTPDGKVINPDDVLEPTTPGAVFVVLECPSEKYIDSFINNEVLSRYQESGANTTAMLVYHICPEDVLRESRYQAWMQRFGPTTKHVALNETCCSVTHEGSRRLQAKLGLVNSDIFPPLPVGSPTRQDREEVEKAGQPSDPKIDRAESYLSYHMRPHTGWDRELLQSPSDQPFINEALAIEGLEQRLGELRTQLASHRTSTTARKYPEVVFLGTGSAMPNKDRNVTGILLNISSTQSLLMDCGEGTYGQMCRFYGDGTDDVLANLRSIFVSHMHADHHGGLIQILRQWKRVMFERQTSSNNLILVGPRRLLLWLNSYNNSCEQFIHQLRFIELGELNVQSKETAKHRHSLLSRLDLVEYETVPVIHCYNSHGLVIRHRDNWKLVYSGDSMPSDSLVQAGRGADVLIHEATLEDGMDEEAQRKHHSMISQAIDVGQRMQAKFILLTHFSQRYSKIPYFNEELSHIVGLAFDNMRVSFSELSQLPICLPALKHLFSAYIQEMQEVRDKKIEKGTIVSLDRILRGGKVIGTEADESNLCKTSTS